MTTSLGAPLLTVGKLRRAFGGVQAVDDVSFELSQGTITCLIGPNGAGKSTALNLIAGALRPDGGTVSLAGERCERLPAHAMAARGVIRTFQLPSEFRRLTVLENLIVAAPRQRGASFVGAFAPRRWWKESEAALLAKARHLLQRFGLAGTEEQYAGELSGGQKRLLELMRALMADPSLLLLDEPLTGVNPTLALEIEAHLAALRSEGMTMLVVEHELGAVDRVSDEVIVMAQGRILATGSMAELRRNQEVIDAYLAG
jgi:ABC-type branched-subunit amino acid transport system ATPase component